MTNSSDEKNSTDTLDFIINNANNSRRIDENVELEDSLIFENDFDGTKSKPMINVFTKSRAQLNKTPPKLPSNNFHPKIGKSWCGKKKLPMKIVN